MIYALEARRSVSGIILMTFYSNHACFFQFCVSKILFMVNWKSFYWRKTWCTNMTENFYGVAITLFWNLTLRSKDLSQNNEKRDAGKFVT